MCNNPEEDQVVQSVISHTDINFSLTHITQTHPHTELHIPGTYCKSVTRVTYTASLWPSTPSVIQVCVSVLVICVCLWCMCVIGVWYVCSHARVCEERDCLIECLSSIIYQETRHGSPTEITHWTGIWQSVTVWIHRIKFSVRACARERAHIFRWVKERIESFWSY